MPTEQNHIPNEVFDWVDSIAFDQLSASQKDSVLTYLSKEEYDEIQLTTLNIKKGLGTFKNSKQYLLDAYDDHFGAKKIVVEWNYFALWKAAVLLLLVSIAGVQLFRLNNNSQILVQNIKDTVFTTPKIIATPKIIHDTIMVMSIKNNNPKPAINAPNNSISNHTYDKQFFPSSVHILSVSELDAKPNQSRGNSLKQDTLIKQFQYTMM